MREESVRGRPRRPARWHGEAAIVLYFAILTFALFGDLLTTSRSVVSAVDMDVDQQFLAWRSFAFGELRHGRLPLWNPYSFGGAPALGNFQYAVLYPPNWLHLVIPVERAINLIAALHAFLAGLLAAAWCRSRRCSIAASMVGGTIFALGGPYILHLYAGHLTYLCVVAWIPLLFLAIDRIISGRATQTAWMLGSVAVAMQVLGGYPQPAYYAGIAAIAYAAMRLLRAPGRAWGRVYVSLATMYALGALLAAAQLLPALDAARQSVRAEPLSYATAASYSLSLAHLLTLIAPYPFGDDFSVPYSGPWVMWEMSLFVGPAALVLAALGALRSKRRADRAALVVATLAILVALGGSIPLFKLLYHAIPGFDRFRAPARFGVVATLMLSVLAARGFDLMLRRRRRGTSRLAVATLVGAGWVAALALLLKARPETWELVLADASIIARSAKHASAQFMRSAVVLAQAGVVLLLVHRFRWLGYALAGLLVADLAMSASHAVQRFQPRHPTFAAVAASPDSRTITIAPGMMNLAAQLGFEDAWGYDPAAPARWTDVVGRLLGADARKGDFAAQRFDPSPLWPMLRVESSIPPTAGFGAAPFPRVLLVDDAKVVNGPAESLAAVFEPSFDPRRQVVLESQPSPPPAKGAAGSAEVTKRALGRLEIVAAVDRPTILLITDAFSAGWRARGYTVLPANHALRAIPLSAGKHSIMLEYAPRSVPIGFAISAAAWAGLIIGSIVVHRRLAVPTNEP